MQARPLDEALENGFNSIEVDVFPVDGKLLVSHNERDIKRDKTIESMYLDKLSARAKANKGAIYPGSKETFWVLVDVKTKGAEAYADFKTILDKYPELKPTKRNSKIRYVISGDRAYEAIAADKGLYAGIDGRIEDLPKHYSDAVMPWISGDWTEFFPSKGETSFPEAQKTKLDTMVKDIHARHKIVRYWGSPDMASCWEIQWKAGVDLINTDHIASLRAWELGQK
jgi:glycerophosphoryl diester phosphodiesterase